MNQDGDRVKYGIVMVTAGSLAEAEAIAAGLVEAKLAACVSITPIKSIYSWEGKIESEEEWQLTIKTDLSQFAALETKVRQLHSYEVPEIIALPIVTGYQPYLEWISANTKRLQGKSEGFPASITRVKIKAIAAVEVT